METKERKTLSDGPKSLPRIPKHLQYASGEGILKLKSTWENMMGFPPSSSLPSALLVHRFNNEYCCRTLDPVMLLPQVPTEVTALVPWPVAKLGRCLLAEEPALSAIPADGGFWGGC